MGRVAAARVPERQTDVLHASGISLLIGQSVPVCGAMLEGIERGPAGRRPAAAQGTVTTKLNIATWPAPASGIATTRPGLKMASL